MIDYQQQLAGTFDFTVRHFTHTNYVSLQESEHKGMQHNPQLLKIKHHMIATVPTFLRGRLPVLLLQAAQREPVPDSPPPETTIVCGWLGAGVAGGGGRGGGV